MHSSVFGCSPEKATKHSGRDGLWRATCRYLLSFSNWPCCERSPDRWSSHLTDVGGFTRLLLNCWSQIRGPLGAGALPPPAQTLPRGERRALAQARPATRRTTRLRTATTSLRGRGSSKASIYLTAMTRRWDSLLHVWSIGCLTTNSWTSCGYMKAVFLWHES